MWEAIDNGNFPEWELGVQIVDEKDEHKFEFDLLDPTKLIPEELVPVQRIGKLTLNRNPDNFFAETEQIAFHPGHLVPGIDFTNDPLLQGRLFSYTDTQLSRLGGPNFHEIPINRPIVDVHNNQRDGIMRQTINKGQSSYHPNSIGGGCPFQAMATEGGFTSHEERIDAKKTRNRSRSFFDHFSQATLFFNSQSEPEKNHIVNALTFELSKVETPAIRERMVGLLTQVDITLAKKVADGLGMPVPKAPIKPMNHSVPADGKQKDYEPIKMIQRIATSAALSMANTIKTTLTRQVAILLSNGVNDADLNTMKSALTAAGIQAKTIAPKMGEIKTSAGNKLTVDMSFLTASSVVFDAVYIPGNKNISALTNEADAIHFIEEAYKHCKAIAANGEGAELISVSRVGNKTTNKQANADAGLILNGKTKQFVEAIAQHRFWERENKPQIPV